MKVYFVGVHNKPDMNPLDSRTMTGSIIDEVCAKVNAECVKTNLADTDHLPVRPGPLAREWHIRNKVNPEDLIVLLGRWVQKHFIRHDSAITIEVYHPASRYVLNDRQAYINELIHTVNEIIAI